MECSLVIAAAFITALERGRRKSAGRRRGRRVSWLALLRTFHSKTFLVYSFSPTNRKHEMRIFISKWVLIVLGTTIIIEKIKTLILFNLFSKTGETAFGIMGLVSFWNLIGKIPSRKAVLGTLFERTENFLRLPERRQVNKRPSKTLKLTWVLYKVSTLRNKSHALLFRALTMSGGFCCCCCCRICEEGGAGHAAMFGRESCMMGGASLNALTWLRKTTRPSANFKTIVQDDRPRQPVKDW